MTLTKPPWMFVEYWPLHWRHGHQLHLGYGPLTGEEIEEAADEFCDVLRRCRPEHHQGHGAYHPSQDIEEAYKAAIDQLQHRDYAKEQRELALQIYRHYRWGGSRPVPAAILLPDEIERGKWNVALVDEYGDIKVVKANPKVTKELPPPQDAGAVKQEFGWRAPTKRRRT